MCGIAAIYTIKKNYDLIYQLILNLQHRGQDSYGYSDGKKVEKYLGLIRNKPSYLTPPIFLAHTRYRTSGSITAEVSQPLLKNNIALIHNGTIQNMGGLNDSYTLLSLLSEQIESGKDILDVIKDLIISLEGAFFIIFSHQNTLYAFKDKSGIRPGILGRAQDGSLVLASENNAFKNLKIKLINDIGPGEIVIINEETITRHKAFFDLSPCIFEYIYLAHPDSILYGKKVKDFRRELAEISIDLLPLDINIDVVCCIPNSARVYARQIATSLNKPYIEPIVKKKRSFIMPDKLSREEYLKQKFTFMQEELINKDILLIDDSIVRGSTAKFIIKTIKKFNKGKIYFLSCAPKVVNVNRYGININSREELVSFNRTHSEIEAYLGCDKLIYQTVENLYNCSGFKNLEISIFK
jgi:amidophosphoribosyltransferase